MTRIPATLLMVCLALFGQAATYYVSHNGNDQNSGTSPSQPWRTIDRVQQVSYSLQPGDQILFERGGVYPGMLIVPRSGNSAQPIVVGAYGSGDRPVISGGEPVINWVQHNGNIWRASVPMEPKYVIVNGAPMTNARHPNTGYMQNVQGSNSSISSPSLSGVDWTGAKVTVRATNWSYETSTVNYSSNGSIHFNPITINLGSDDWGFFMSGKLSLLDTQGEWAYENGQLFLWAPDNVNPNYLSVLASIHQKGIIPSWQQSHIRIENITFQGQTVAGVSTEGAGNVTVTGCEFRYCYIGLQSSGTNNFYIGNDFHDTFASAMDIYDTGVLIENNTYNDIAIRPGMGQDVWGYWAIRTTGYGAIIRGNRLNNIGYIGIDVGKDALVEHNVVVNATSMLNDGAGISFDNCNGAIIRDNIVRDCVGNMEGVATSHIAYYPIVFGIYFGNTSIKNTTVERNTVARCNGAGIHVDHTQVSEGNQIKDNVLFDNNVQLSLSDASNTTGPGASPPYYVPNFNDVYSGNIMYSIRPEQLCMRQYHCHSTQHVDYGTFTNNKYFNPYQELSIMIRNPFGGGIHNYTMERWQATFGEDAGSTRSPLRLADHVTTSELSGDLITNGDFSSPFSGWAIFPTNALVSIDYTYLDNGALKAYLPSNQLYNSLSLRSPDQFSMQSGQWYRMRLSVQSDQHGIMRPGVKGVSQLMNANSILSREIPFSPERRDLEFYFQSDLTEQAILTLANDFDFPRYWIDNIELHRVNVQPVDPNNDHKLLINELTVAQSFSLPPGCWSDVYGNMLSDDVTVQPYSSKVIYRVPGSGCDQQQAYSVGAKVFLGGAFVPTGVMRTDLLTHGLLPTTEPYSAMGGFNLQNAGAQVSSALLQATGPEALVDWVVLELRNPGDHSLAEQRAALVRANGDVVAPDGSAQIPFNTPVQGKHLVIKHRNHLGAMTLSPIATNGAVIDLTSSSTETWGDYGRCYVTGTLRGLWPGDVNHSNVVSYTNANNDRDEILVAIGSVVPSNVTEGYHKADVNLDGVVKYTGIFNDRDVILTTIGGSAPTAIRVGQLP